MGPREFILTTVVPGLIVGVSLLLAWILHGRRKEKSHAPDWVVPIALAIGFSIPFWNANPPSRWWPISGPERILQIAGMAMLAGLACVWIRKPTLAKHVIAAVSIAIAVWVMLESLPVVSQPQMTLAIWVVAVSCGGAPAVAMMNAGNGRAPGWLRPVQLIAIALATSAISLFSSNALFAQMGGCLVAMACAATTVGLIRKDFSLSPAGTLVFYIFVAVLCTGASQFANHPLHWSLYALVLCAPIGSVAGMLVRRDDKNKWKPVLFALAGVLVPLITAVVIGYLTRYVPVPYDY